MSKNFLLIRFRHLLRSFEEAVIYSELKKTKKLDFGINNIIFDHTNSEKAKLIIHLIKNKFQSRNKFISVPHGQGIFKNKMLEYSDLNVPKKLDLSVYDLVVCSDIWHFDTIEAANKIIISPLRYTKEWVNKFEQFYAEKKTKNKEQKKNNFF
jgi:hypothetical protein